MSQIAKTNTSEELFETIFASVCRRGGKIASFSYQKKFIPLKNREGGECRFSVYGCDCEEIANARYCVVSFKNGEPHFELLLPFENVVSAHEKIYSTKKDKSPPSEPSFFSCEDNLLEMTAVHTKLREFGSIIESEFNGDDIADFSFVTDSSRLYSCLKVCEERSERLGWQEERISIFENAGKCRIHIRLAKQRAENQTEFLACGEILQMCANYAFLFASESKIQPKKQNFVRLGLSTMPILSREKISEEKRRFL